MLAVKFCHLAERTVNFGIRTLLTLTFLVAIATAVWTIDPILGYIVSVVAFPVFFTSLVKIQFQLSLGELSLLVAFLTIVFSLIGWSFTGGWQIFGTSSQGTFISLVFFVIAGVVFSFFSLGVFFAAIPFIETFLQKDHEDVN